MKVIRNPRNVEVDFVFDMMTFKPRILPQGKNISLTTTVSSRGTCDRKELMNQKVIVVNNNESPQFNYGKNCDKVIENILTVKSFLEKGILGLYFNFFFPAVKTSIGKF